MKAILWKEFRENAKWTLLILAVLTIAQCFALASDRSGGGSFYANVTLLGSLFLMVTSFGSALAGTALGLLQILPEQARDQWASLLHRPAGRGVIFAGKAGAGSLLVLLATGIPLLLSVVYVQIPGQFAAPFVPGMIFPAMSDLFLGQAFYFGALALGLQRGSWWGARGLLALSALPVFILHIFGPWPVLGSLVASGIYLFCAWGAMGGGSRLQDRPRMTRLAFVASVLVGTFTLLAVVSSVISLLPIWSQPVSVAFRHFSIARDGSIFIMTYDGSDTPSLTDLNGRPVTDARYLSNEGGAFLNGTYVTFTFEQPMEIRSSFIRQNPRLPLPYLMRASMDYDSPELWFYLVRERIFVGYDKLSRRLAGSLGRDGFHPPGEPAEPFRVPLLDSNFPLGVPHFYAEGNQLYEIDFGDRVLRPFFDSGNASLVGFAGLQQLEKFGGVAVATEKNLHILGADGESLAVLDYRHDPLVWGEIVVAINNELQRIYVIARPSQQWPYAYTEGAVRRPVFLEEYSLQGVHQAGYEIPPAIPSEHEPGIRGLITEALTPFAPLAVSSLIVRMQGRKPLSLPGNTQIFSGPPASIRALILSFTFSAVFALVAWQWARHVGFGAGDAARWAVFVFCFGLAGLITFRLASSWPVRVGCPTCKKLRAIHVPDCPHCRSPWPSPARIGQEIFGES